MSTRTNRKVPVTNTQAEEVIEFVDVTVVADAAMWNEPARTASGFIHRSEFKGWTGPMPVTIAEEKRKKGDVVFADEAPEGVEPAPNPDPVPTLGEDMTKWSSAEAIAWINQHSNSAEDLAQLYGVELDRNPIRAEVVEALDTAINLIEEKKKS